jgi:tetratricopeptide (TPR) repeat protein
MTTRLRAFGAAALLALLPATAARTAEPAPEVASGIRLFEEGKDEEARAALLPAALAKAGDAVAAYYLGRIAGRLGNFKEAARWLEKAVKLDEMNPLYHAWLGRVYAQQAQRASPVRQPFLARKMKAHWDRAVQLDPEDLDVRQDLIEYYVRAPGFMGGSVAKAKEQAEEIRQRDRYRGHLAAGRLAESQKDPQGAEREFREAVGAFPDSVGARYALGFFLQRTEQYESAFTTFEEILAEKPAEANALYQIGRTGALSGQRLERAEQALMQYLTAPPKADAPKPAAAHWRLGMVYEKQGRKDLARQEYQTAVRLDPEQDGAKKALAKLK